VKFCVAEVRPVDANVSSFDPTVPYLPSPEKVAIPLTAEIDVLPVKLPLSIETVTAAVDAVTVLPDAS
jgi:hypothetical protein